MKRLGPGVVVALLLALAAMFGISKPADPALWPARGEGRVTVWVVDNGYHANLVVPRAALADSGGPSARALADVPPGPWVAIGWGDRRFYTESGFDARRAVDGLRALFVPGNASVTMFAPLNAAPDRLWRTGVVRLELSRAGFAAMIARVDRSLLLRGGKPIPGPRGPDPQSRFFESREHFSLFRLCNHWAAGVLNAGGVPIRPVLDSWSAGLAFDLNTRALKGGPNSTR
jgi:hypothetical protein